MVHQWEQEYGFHLRDDLLFKRSVHGGIFAKHRLVLSELFSSERLFLGVPHALWVVDRFVRRQNANTVCTLYSLAVIISTRFLCRTPPRFNATDAVFPLTNQCRSISTSLVSFLSIFGRIGSGKSARTPSTLIVAPTISYHTLVGIDSGFVPWDNSSNMLKDRCRLIRRRCRVEING